MTIAIPDFVITVAYFSIPLQILASLWRYPSLAVMPVKLVLLLVLFALFIFMCGAGHLLKSMKQSDTHLYEMVNLMTAVVSISTALYLLPVVPCIFAEIDQRIRDFRANEAAAKSKADELAAFMAFLCHEIRNPLYVITAASQFMSDGDSENLTPDQERGMEAIVDSANLMLRLVQDVLDLSKIEAGKMEFEESEFNILRLLDHLRISQSVQVQQKHGSNVQLEWDVSSEIPAIVNGDSTRLMQIVCNLFSNAVKFTATGVIRLKASLVCNKCENDQHRELFDDDCDHLDVEKLWNDMEEGAGPSFSSSKRLQKPSSGTFLCIQVSDTGTGIAPNRLEYIFQPYSQAKLSDYRKHGGTGLGLSIVSSLLKLMGGSIRVASTVGEGSTFTVLFPLSVHSNRHHAGVPPTAPTTTMAPENQTEDKPAACDNAEHNDNNGGWLMEPRNDFRSASLRRDTVGDRAGCYFSSEQEPELRCDSSPSKRTSVASDSPLRDESFDGEESCNKNSHALFLKESSSPNSLLLSQQQAQAPLFASSSFLSSDGQQQQPQPTLSLIEPVPLQPQEQQAAAAPIHAASSPSSPTIGGAHRIEKKPALRRFDFEPGTNVVLIVDDNKVNRKIMARTLSLFGVEHEEAENGQIAVDMVLKRRAETETGDCYGMILMDLMMPVMDGVEATEALRSEEIATPIVALTANSMTQEKEQFLAAGANDFMTKPILREQVHQLCVRFLLENTQQRQ